MKAIASVFLCLSIASAIAQAPTPSAADRERASQVVREFLTAAEKKDPAVMAARMEEYKGLPLPREITLRMMTEELALARRDWQTATSLLKESGKFAALAASTMAVRATSASQTNYPSEFLKTLLSAYNATVVKKGGGAYSLLVAASLQSKLGDQKSAIKTARRAAAAARKEGMFPEVFDRFLKSLEDGALPSREDLGQWLNDAAMKQRAATKQPS